MSVLIKGLKMPECCDLCPIMVFEDTNCVPELFCGCPIVFKAHPQGVDHRPDYCPLIEIPPHGDLVDKQQMAETNEQHYQVFKGDEAADYARQVVLRMLDQAPTIIEAEEVYNKYTDTAGNLHWTGTRSGEHTIRAEEGE